MSALIVFTIAHISKIKSNVMYSKALNKMMLISGEKGVWRVNVQGDKRRKGNEYILATSDKLSIEDDY